MFNAEKNIQFVYLKYIFILQLPEKLKHEIQHRTAQKTKQKQN